MDRNQLIDRKQSVIAQMQRTRRQLEALRLRSDKVSQRRARELENRLDTLMAEEARLRQEIDRNR